MILADFESSPDGWQGANGGTIALSKERATHGAGSLKVDLAPGSYPGAGIEFSKPQDWSACSALRFSVFNTSSQTIALNVRVDDAASKNFATRYNGDMYPHKLAPGPNEVEVTVAALRQGSFLARGLDVTRIKQLRLFATVKQPVTLYLDNVRLVRRVIGSPARLDLLAAPARCTATGGADPLTIRPGVGGESSTVSATGSPTVDVTLPPTASYPGVSIAGFDPNWLDFDTLWVAVEGTRGLKLLAKLTDKAGRSQTIGLPPLPRGPVTLRIPLEIAAEVSLGKVAQLQIFSGQVDNPASFSLRTVALSRSPSVDFPTVYDDPTPDGPVPDQAMLKLDLSKFNAPRNTCVMAMVRIPLADGTSRIVRCNAPNRGPASYAIPAAAFVGASRSARDPVSVWAFVSDHGVWSYWQQTCLFDGTPKTVQFITGEQK